MLRLMNAESKTIFGAATVVGVLSFVSRIVGFLRDRILAGEFGAGDTLDVYYSAFKVPDALFSLIVIGSLSASFIPLFTKHYGFPGGKQAAWKLTNNVLNLIVVSMIGLSLLMMLFAEPLASVIAPGFDVGKQHDVAGFMRIMLLAQIILAGSVVYGSVLQGMKRFVLYSLAPVLYNVGIIVGGVWLARPDMLGEIGLAWGVVIGAILHLCVQIYGVWAAGYRYEWTWKPRDRESLEILKLMGPRMIGIAVGQANIVLLGVIASTLGVGSVTIFQFAYNIQFFPVGIFGVSYAIAAFPSFVEHLDRRDTNGFVQTFSSTVRQILFFLIPMMMVFLILRAQIVRVVVGAGQFDWASTILTADALAFFALSFIAQALVFVLARAFFALRDTATPLVAGIASATIGIAMAFWLSRDYGVVGLAMAYTASSIMNLALLWVPLRARVGSLDELKLIQSLFVLSSAGVLCGVVTQFLKPVAASFMSLDTFLGVLGQGLFAGGFGIAAYVGVCILLRSEEAMDIWGGIRRRVFRKYQPKEPVATETPSAS